jgi:cytochrome c oxidase cbb3-type subunit 4
MIMNVSHEDLVWLAQTFGLFYLIGLSLIVLVYVYWPSNKKRFDQAAEAILQGEDRPWR